MAKYTSEFKLKVVQYYLSGKYGGYNIVAKHFKIPSISPIKIWVEKFQNYGEKGLLKNNIKYDGNFKLSVIEYMHNNHLSLTQTCIKFNLGNPNIIDKWERIYYEEGPQALFEERRGKRKNMNSKPSKKKLCKEVEEDLIAENQRLRMENAYLKKLRALVQERVQRENPTKHKPSAN